MSDVAQPVTGHDQVPELAADDVETARKRAITHHGHPLGTTSMACRGCNLSTAEAFRLGFLAGHAAAGGVQLGIRPCPSRSPDADGWHCAVESPHGDGGHANAAGVVTW